MKIGKPVTLAALAAVAAVLAAAGRSPAAAADGCAAAGPDAGVFSGKVVLAGKPAPGLTVSVHRDAADEFQGKGCASAVTSAEGLFAVGVEPGRYYLLAGGPGTGGAELFAYYGGNPVSAGRAAATEVNMQAVVRQAASASYWKGEGALLEGVILGPQGPEEGAMVFAFPDAGSDFRGPDISGPQGSVSGGSEAGGRFSAELPPGRYFIVASRRRGGGPLGPLRAGDLHGYFSGNPVVLESGRRVAVTVAMVEKLRETTSRRTASASPAGVSGVLRDTAGKPRPGLFAFATTDPNMAGGMPPFRSLPVAEDGAYRLELPAGRTYYIGARSGYGGPPLPGEWFGVHGGDQPAPVSVGSGMVEGLDITVKVME